MKPLKMENIKKMNHCPSILPGEGLSFSRAAVTRTHLDAVVVAGDKI